MREKNQPLLLVFAWLLVMGSCVIAYEWLSHAPAIPRWSISTGISPIYMGTEWLRFHRVNAPRKPGERHIVIIGSSNIAGGGDDYRCATRQRVDPWGRHSFARHLEKEMQNEGVNVRVSNLAVNGSRLRSQVFLYLYALDQKPDLIVFALSLWTFVRDGDFRDPKNMRAMNSELLKLMDRRTHANEKTAAKAFRDYLVQQPSGPWRSPLSASRLDQFTACLAAGMDGMYRRIGLPPFLSAPSPQHLVESVHRMEKERGPSNRKDAAASLVVFEEMVGLFPAALPVLQSTAEQAGVRLIALVPPDSSEWVRWFYDERKRELETRGICTIDLGGMPMRPEIETFDGHHFTNDGKKKLAKAFWKALQKIESPPQI